MKSLSVVDQLTLILEVEGVEPPAKGALLLLFIDYSELGLPIDRRHHRARWLFIEVQSYGGHIGSGSKIQKEKFF